MITEGVGPSAPVGLVRRSMGVEQSLGMVFDVKAITICMLIVKHLDSCLGYVACFYCRTGLLASLVAAKL